MYIKNVFRKIVSRGPVSVILAVVLSVLFVTGLVNAATTISENIVTAGTLQVDLGSTLTGAVTMGTSLKVGSSGTAVTRVNAGTCYIKPYAATIAATSTVVVDCQGTLAWDAVAGDAGSALTGVTAGDFVVATLSTTTAGTTSGGLRLTGASASTTAGYIQLNISNLTGAVYTWPVAANTASGTASYIVVK